MTSDPSSLTPLPQPDRAGRMALERAIAARRSIRAFEGASLPLAQLGQLLWAGQGKTGAEGFRAAPSAGALYPLELYALTGEAGDLGAGIYHYRPQRHALHLVAKGDFRADFASAALAQDWVTRAGVIMVVAAVPARVMAKYGQRGRRYLAIEAGHCAQNIYLQAAALGLGGSELGAFDDAALAGLLRLPDGEEPVTTLAIGQPFSAPRP